MAIIIRFLNQEKPEESTMKALDLVKEGFKKQSVPVEIYFSPLETDADFLVGTFEKSPLIRKLATEKRLALYQTPEALSIQEVTINGAPVTIIGAYDTRGLNYALYELAERINAQPLSMLGETVVEKPSAKIREVLTFHHFRRPAPSFFDLSYWEAYFSLLVKTRFNRFCLFFYEPQDPSLLPFPYLLDVPGFPEIRVTGLDAEERERNLMQLRAIAEAAHCYGIDFIFGLEQNPPGKEKSPLPFFIKGLAAENLIPYTYSALKQLLAFCPQIKGIFLRWGKEKMTEEEQTAFLAPTYIRALKETNRRVELRISGKRLAPEMPALLKEAGIPFSVSYDHGRECFDLPYKPVKTAPEGISGGYPQQPYAFPVCHELWSAGSHRLLLWGDPELALRLTQTLELTGKTGLTVAPPSAWKDRGYEEGMSLFPTDYSYYTWEFERYWYFYLLFGRLSYNPQTSGRIWSREFIRRFGEAGTKMAEVYSLAGKILCLYVSARMGEVKRKLRPETDTGGLLDYYLATPPGDPEIFCSIEDYAREYLEGEASGLITPETVAEYLWQLGTRLLETIEMLREKNPGGPPERGKEWKSTLLDFMILANFALYHAGKIRSAVNLALYYQTRDLTSLLAARNELRKTVFYWQQIIKAAEGRSFPRLEAGPGGAGSWRDKLLLLLEDEKRLDALIREHRQRGIFTLGFDFGVPPRYSRRADFTNSSPGTGFYVEKGYTYAGPRTLYSQEKGFGWLNTEGLRGIASPPVRLCDQDLDLEQDGITGAYGLQLFNDLVWGFHPAVFQVDLEPGSYQIHLTLCDRSEKPLTRGPMGIKVNGETLADNLVVPAGKRVDFKKIVTVGEEHCLIIEFSGREGHDWFVSALTIRPTSPVIAHTPVMLTPGKPQVIQATVTGAEPVTGVFLHYQTEKNGTFRRTPMTPAGDGLYRVEFPAAEAPSGRISRYYIIVAGEQNKKLAACGTPEKPVTARWKEPFLNRPRLYHQPPEIAPASEDLEISVSTDDPGKIKKILLAYRRLNQGGDFHLTEMHRTGAQFTAQIPVSYFAYEESLAYFFRVVTACGEGYIFPDPLEAIPYYLKVTGNKNTTRSE